MGGVGCADTPCLLPSAPHPISSLQGRRTHSPTESPAGLFPGRPSPAAVGWGDGVGDGVPLKWEQSPVVLCFRLTPRALSRPFLSSPPGSCVPPFKKKCLLKRLFSLFRHLVLSTAFHCSKVSLPTGSPPNTGFWFRKDYAGEQAFGEKMTLFKGLWWRQPPV